MGFLHSEITYLVLCFSLVVDPHVFPFTFSQIALAELLFEKGIIHTAEPL